MAEAHDRPLIYLASSAGSKEDLARQVAARDAVSAGLVCVLTCVEPCWTYQIFRNREAKKLELRRSFPEGKPDAAPKWLPLRKGTADIYRRAELSQASNDRYLDALAPCVRVVAA